MQMIAACPRLYAPPATAPRQRSTQQGGCSSNTPLAAAAAASQPRRSSRPTAPQPPSPLPFTVSRCPPGRALTVAVAAAGRYDVPDSAAGSAVVQVCPDEAAVAQFLCDTVEAAATAAIAERGIFTLAIPGGSVLKALAGLAARPSAIPWDKVRLFFVNHKTVPNEDAATSSYAKARGLFLDAVEAPPGCVATLMGTDDAEAEAAAYAAALSAAAEEAGMERAPSGAPRFDLLLLGVGADGHVGSLYPGGAATLADPAGPWVLPVVKAKPPASITLSLGVMNAACSVVVCLTGAKKAAAAKLALETPVPAGDFPAQLVQPDLAPAVWLLDEAAAAELAAVKAGSGSEDSSGTGAAGKASAKDPYAGEPQADGSILYTF